MNNETENIYEVKDCVDREISEANIYYELLFKLINGILSNKNFYEEFKNIFFFIQDALETKYILALGKLFASSREASLWKLISLAKEVPLEIFEEKLKRDPAFVHAEMQNERTLFLTNSDNYITEIQRIEKKISPLRNRQRAHNFLGWTTEERVLWIETREWLTFAEKIFFNTTCAICETSFQVGDFFPKELESEIAYFISQIKDIEIKLATKKLPTA